MSLDELFQPGDFNGEQAAQVERRPALVSDAVPECVQRESTRTILKLETGVRWERLTAVPVGDIDFLWVTYPPGSTTSADGSLMRHPGHEFGVLLTGKLEVTVEFDTYELTAHDSISFASTTPHLLRNTTDEPTTAIWFVIGRRGAAPHIEPSAPAPPLDGDSAT
jgi:mannose-6-phosphate isomerase-like protein (cupin superfamily)